MPNPPIFYEPGNNLPLLSLGGVVSQTGQGRVVQSNSATMSPGAQFAIPPNTKRISMIIMNVGDGSQAGGFINIFIGSLNTIPVYLQPGGTLQIDRYFPWIGEVDVQGNGVGSPVCVWVEVGLQ